MTLTLPFWYKLAWDLRSFISTPTRKAVAQRRAWWFAIWWPVERKKKNSKHWLKVIIELLTCDPFSFLSLSLLIRRHTSNLYTKLGYWSLGFSSTNLNVVSIRSVWSEKNLHILIKTCTDLELLGWKVKHLQGNFKKLRFLEDVTLHDMC